jgi:hypothetical protein
LDEFSQGGDDVEAVTTIFEWHKQLLGALASLEELRSAIVPPPAEGDARDRLPLLLGVWEKLSVNAMSMSAATDAAGVWADKLIRVKEDVRDQVAFLVSNLDRAIGDALNSGAAHAWLIRTADFGQLRQLDSNLRMPELAMAPIFLSVGLIGSLPQGHRLRTLLPTNEYYLHGSREPGIVLGPPYANGTTRRWYTTAEAIELTRRYRAQQVRALEEQAEQERLEKEEQKRRWYETPEGRLMQIQERLEKLKATGQVPEKPPAIPAVRRGGDAAAELERWSRLKPPQEPAAAPAESEQRT